LYYHCWFFLLHHHHHCFWLKVCFSQSLSSFFLCCFLLRFLLHCLFLISFSSFFVEVEHFVTLLNYIVVVITMVINLTPSKFLSFITNFFKHLFFIEPFVASLNI
jgi:hypothetical protein